MTEGMNKFTTLERPIVWVELESTTTIKGILSPEHVWRPDYLRIFVGEAKLWCFDGIMRFTPGHGDGKAYQLHNCRMTLSCHTYLYTTVMRGFHERETESYIDSLDSDVVPSMGAGRR